VEDPEGGEDTTATTPAAELVAAGPEALPPEADDGAETEPVGEGAEAANVEPPAGGRAETATPHCPIGLFPGRLSNCSPTLPMSSGTALGIVHLVPSGLI